MNILNFVSEGATPSCFCISNFLEDLNSFLKTFSSLCEAMFLLNLSMFSWNDVLFSVACKNIFVQGSYYFCDIFHVKYFDNFELAGRVSFGGKTCLP